MDSEAVPTSTGQDANGELIVEDAEIKLIFFGTFVHDNSTNFSIDLVQFPKPILVNEIRVIPLGASVELSNGSCQLGATNPSEIELEFFYDDLQDPSKTVFENFGKFTYNEKSCIHIANTAEYKVITNGVLVRGKYSTITLAVYGHAVKVPVKEESPSIKVEKDNMEKMGDINLGSNSKIEGAGTRSNVKIEPLEGGDSKSPTDLTSENEAESKVLDKTSFAYPDSRSRSTSLEGIELKSVNGGGEELPRPNESPISQNNQIFDDVKSQSPKSGDGEPSKEKVEAMDVDTGVDEDSLEDISDGEIGGDDEEEGGPPPKIIKLKEDSPESKISESSHLSIKDEPSQSAPMNEKLDELASGKSEREEEFEDNLDQDFEEILSDDDLPEITEPDDFDAEEWEDYLNSKLNRGFNPFSDSLSISPLSNFSIDPESLNKHDFIGGGWRAAIEKYSEDKWDTNLMEDWVECIESLLPSLSCNLKGLPEDELELINGVLGFWVELGMNLELAIQHTSPPFIIRHLKVGIRLVQALGNVGGTIGRILVQREFFGKAIQHVLIDLFQQKHMNLPMQLLILRALDSTLSNSAGFNQFKTGKNSEGNTGLQRLISYFVNNTKQIRLSFALRSILKKVQFWSCLQSLEEFAGKIQMANESEDSESESFSLMAEECCDILEELSNLIENSEQLMSHPLRILPAKSLVELPQLTSPESSPKKSLIKILQEMNFIPLCSKLVATKNLRIIPSIHSVLKTLLEWESGLVLLCNGAQDSLILLRGLMRWFYQDEGLGEDENFGVYLAYCCEVMSSLDKIISRSKMTQSPLDPTTMDSDLNALQIMTSFIDNSIGRRALINTLTLGQNIKPILAYYQPGIGSLTREERSVRISYANDIISLLIRQGDDVKFLERFGEEIHKIISSQEGEFEEEEMDKMNKISPYLAPTLIHSNFTLDGIEPLVLSIESQIGDFLGGSRSPKNNFGFPPHLFTALRILQSLCLPPNQRNVSSLRVKPDENIIKELKYDIATVKCHGADLLTLLLSILNKINEEFPQPALQSYLLVGVKGDLLAALLLPLMRIMRCILCKVIQVRQQEYKDVTPIPILLRIYGLLDLYPCNSLSLAKVQEIKQNIIVIFLAYSIPAMKQGEESPEVLHKNTWTTLIKETLKFTCASPHSFIPGLDILSELLPSPLPQNGDPHFSELGTGESVKLRRLWSTYLHVVSNQIQEMIRALSTSKDPKLLESLNKVCIQLSDAFPSFWMTTTFRGGPEEEEDGDQTFSDLIPIDLIAWSKAHLNDVDIEKEVGALCKIEQSGEDVEDSKKGVEEKIKVGLLGIAPRKTFQNSRGSFSRGMMSGRPLFDFRTRTPNTSRPPSLHVDDFVLMEGGGGGGGAGGSSNQGGVGGYNKQMPLRSLTHDLHRSRPPMSAGQGRSPYIPQDRMRSNQPSGPYYQGQGSQGGPMNRTNRGRNYGGGDWRSNSQSPRGGPYNNDRYNNNGGRPNLGPSRNVHHANRPSGGSPGQNRWNNNSRNSFNR